jgi:hypothetical protein
VKNTLLQHENSQLKEALANEKKRRQRGKALLLLPPENSAGKAQVWSPTKVEQARQCQKQKDLKEQAAQYQKTQAMKLREQQKLAKAQQLKERRLNRVVAKEKQEREADCNIRGSSPFTWVLSAVSSLTHSDSEVRQSHIFPVGHILWIPRHRTESSGIVSRFSLRCSVSEPLRTWH